jgi:hypothetical protein
MWRTQEVHFKKTWACGRRSKEQGARSEEAEEEEEEERGATIHAAMCEV